VFNTKGEEEGTIRVEFIPRVRRAALRDITPGEPPKRVKQELECNEDLSSDNDMVSDTDTEEF